MIGNFEGCLRSSLNYFFMEETSIQSIQILLSQKLAFRSNFTRGKEKRASCFFILVQKLCMANIHIHTFF